MKPNRTNMPKGRNTTNNMPNYPRQTKNYSSMFVWIIVLLAVGGGAYFIFKQQNVRIPDGGHKGGDLVASTGNYDISTDFMKISEEYTVNPVSVDQKYRGKKVKLRVAYEFKIENDHVSSDLNPDQATDTAGRFKFYPKNKSDLGELVNYGDYEIIGTCKGVVGTSPFRYIVFDKCTFRKGKTEPEKSDGPEEWEQNVGEVPAMGIFAEEKK